MRRVGETGIRCIRRTPYGLQNFQLRTHVSLFFLFLFSVRDDNNEFLALAASPVVLSDLWRARRFSTRLAETRVFFTSSSFFDQPRGSSRPLPAYVVELY